MQCKDFLACSNDKVKPELRETSERHKEKSNLVNGIVAQTQKLKEKIKGFGFFFRTKELGGKNDVDLEISNINTLRNDQFLHNDKRMHLIDSIIENISGQISRRLLDKEKLEQAIDQLKTLKIQVSLQS